MSNETMKKIAEYGKLASAISVGFALLSGLVAIVGGRLPPWPTYKEYMDLQSKVTMLRVDVDAVYTLNAVQQCIDWNRRWRNASMRYQELKGQSAVDLDIMNEAELRIRQIPMCILEGRR